MLHALARIAESPMWYMAISQTLLFAFAGAAVCAAFSPRLNERLSTRLGTGAFLALALAALAGARWPTFFVTDMLNQDEAQALAQAITALHHPMPWLSFDGNTCGPLNTYVLMLPALFGFHLSFFSTRVIAVLLEFGAAAALYGCATLCFDAALARVAIVPPIAFFALATQEHFIHYSGEHLSIFLGMLGLWLFCLAAKRKCAPSLLFATGVVAGMIPFAKIQAAPIAVATAAVAAAGIFAGSASGLREKLARIGALCAGCLSFPALLLAAVAAFGAFHDFWISYIASSLAYILYDYEPLSFLTGTPQFGPQFDVLLAVALAGGLALVWRWKPAGPGVRGAFAASLVVAAAAVDAIYAPKRGSLNYLLFGILPIACAAAAGLGVLGSAFGQNKGAGMRRGLLALGFVAASLAAQSAFARPEYPYLAAVGDYFTQPPDPVGAMIRRYLSEGDRLAIWGYRPKYFVYSYTLLGTRDAISKYQLKDGLNPYLGYYRARFIDDLNANRPRGFLDAGRESFDFDKKGRWGHETFPELAAAVRRDYRLVASVGDTRLYLRRDVLDPQLSKSP